MHDEDDVPPLSDEAARFLRGHGDTGAPTTEELLRVKERVLSRSAPVAKVVPLPTKPRRSFLPPEVLAVAALVAFAVVAQLVYLAFRPDVVTGVDDPGLGRIATAYRTGGLQQARLAASSCTSAACASMSAKLLRALELSSRFEKLDDAEADELARLDVDLSGGVATELTKALEDRRKNVTLTPDQLLASATSLTDEKHYESALGQLRRCLERDPKHAGCIEFEKTVVAAQESEVEGLVTELRALKKARDLDGALAKARACTVIAPSAAICYRFLGAGLAAVATRDQSPERVKEARAAYERFLELAPPDDEFVPKVRAILSDEAVPATPSEPMPVDPQAARDWAQKRQGAQARDLYLRGYQLKESDPSGALALFRKVMTLTSPEDVLYQKAKSRIAELEEDKRPTEGDTELPALTLMVGQSIESEYLPGLVRVAIGNGAVIDVKTLGKDRLRVTANDEGTTTLLVWKTDGTRISQRIEVKR